MQRVHKTLKYLLNPEHPITIALIGCGGNGSQMLTQLARIDQALKKLGHIGIHVTCFDNDIVTEANMGRQLFSPAEVGMNKATAMITRINRFFGTSWKAMPVYFNGSIEERIRNANITISCVDTIHARWEISEALTKSKHDHPELKTWYWMDLGNTQNSGQFILGTLKNIEQPLKGKKTGVFNNYVPAVPTVFEKFPGMKKQKEKDTGPSCSLAEALEKQDLFINSTLVQFASGLLWKLFREGQIKYHGAFINLETLKIAPIYL